MDSKNGLADYPVAFCDSLAALEAAYADGLPRTARISSLSPTLVCTDVAGVEAAESKASEKAYEEIQQATLPFSVEVFSALNASDDLRPYALTVARMAANHHKFLYKAACLGSEDFSEPRAVLTVDVGDPEHNKLITAPWADLLGCGANLRTRMFADNRPATPWLDKPSRGRSLRLLGWRQFGYKFAFWLSRYLPASATSGQALILHANELVTETAFQLALRGYGLKQLVSPPMKAPALAKELSESLRDVLVSRLRRHITRWVVREAMPACEENLLAQAVEAVSRQIVAKAYWQSELERLELTDKTMVLSSYPGGPEAVALAEVCRPRGIPFIAFQHGNGREICAAHGEAAAWYENGVSDLLCTFNETASRVSEAIPFARGRCISVGLPLAYFKVGKLDRKKVKYPIIYVSTVVYRGNLLNMYNGSMTDSQRAQWELDLIDEVFDHLPHRTMYKTYPALARYPDPDPVVERARKSDKLTLFEAPLDMRYLFGLGRLIVTSCATSTVGWCLMSGLPLVFIDLRRQAPLTDEARVVFAEGVFLFEGDSSSSLEQIRVFLSQPLAMIEKEWERKAPARARLIERFISSHGPGAGMRAANEILSLLNSNNSGLNDTGLTKNQGSLDNVSSGAADD